MRNCLVAATAALAIVCAGLALSDPAQAGASASAATKYSRASSTSSWTGWWGTRPSSTATEFSSRNRR
jgi:hypothetical protein